MIKKAHFGQDLETQLGYDSQTNYSNVVWEYKTALAAGNKDKAERLLDIHGGKLALCMKREYQKTKECL